MDKALKSNSLFNAIIDFGCLLLSPFPWILLGTIVIITVFDLVTLYIGFFTAFFTNIAWLLLTPVLWILSLARLVTTSFRNRVATYAVVVGLAFFFARPTIVSYGIDLYLLVHKPQLDRFADDIRSYGIIEHLSDFQRYSCKVNDIYCNDDSVTAPETCLDHVMLPAAEAGIDTLKLTKFVDELRQARLINFNVHGDLIDFCYDGFLDNSTGFICVFAGDPPGLGAHFGGGEIFVISHISGRWYRYGTT